MASAGSIGNRQQHSAPATRSGNGWRLILVCAAFGAVGFGFLAIALSSRDIRPGPLLVLLGVGAVIGMLIGAEIDAGRTLLYLTHSQESNAGIRDVVVRLFASNGWALGGELPGSIWYSHQLRPRLGVAILLALLGVVPAIVYLVVSRRTQTARVSWTPAGNGYDVAIEITYQGHGGRKAANWIVSQI